MRRERNSRGGRGGGGGGRGNGRGRGGGGGGRGRGGGGGRGRGGGGGRHHGRGGGRGRGGGGGRGRGGGGRGRHQGGNSGNQRERIQVESGHLVLVDQFMLANPQFLNILRENLDEDPEKKNETVQRFGGSVVELTPATYRIERDPYALTIVIHQDGEKPESDKISETATEARGHVFIDTRCLAMVDRELLDDIALLEKYQQLWFNGEDKACRDLLRDNGGAVRYGFRRFGDELGVFSSGDDGLVALWPDISETVEEEASGDEDASASSAAEPASEEAEPVALESGA